VLLIDTVLFVSRSFRYGFEFQILNLFAMAFLNLSRPALEITWPPIQWVPCFSQG